MRTIYDFVSVNPSCSCGSLTKLFLCLCVVYVCVYVYIYAPNSIIIDPLNVYKAYSKKHE